MNAFECAGRLERGLVRDIEQLGRLNEKEGPQSLAAAKRGIAHGFGERRGRVRVRPGDGVVLAKEDGKPRLDLFGDAVDFGSETHDGEGIAEALCRRKLIASPLGARTPLDAEE